MTEGSGNTDLGLSRYVTPEMGRIWSDDSKFRVWAKVETSAAAAQGAPENVIKTLTDAKVPTAAEVSEVESITNHDVTAFLKAWTRDMTSEASDWVHKGMTSSDLVDSANGIRLHGSNKRIIDELDVLIRAMAAHALKHRRTLRVGRTHGQHAEVTTWGHRVADITLALVRARVRMDLADRQTRVVMLSGPVGDYKRVTWTQEHRFAHLLGMMPSTSSTQVIMRDGYADLMSSCGILASVLEAFALEVRLGQRTEVGELAEGFGEGQQGSSSMPHKRNPILSENLTGLAKLVRAQIVPVMEGVALHHERDISHSSVERVALPTALCLTQFMLVRTTELLANLVVNTDRMLENIDHTKGAIMSAAAREWLIEQGLGSSTAWMLVDRAATAQRQGGSGLVEQVRKLSNQYVSQGLDGNQAPEYFRPDWVAFEKAMAASATPGDDSQLFDLIKRLAGQ